MPLPIFLSQVKELSLMQTRWANILNPFIASPINGASVLKNIQLSSGTNQINHKLGQNLQGWFIVRQRGSATIYDQQDSNSSPQLTLTLVSSAPVSVDIAVF